MRTVLDLTHTLSEDMPVYPGTEPPTFRPANTVEKDGFAEKLISMYSHTGTHIDAPAHMLAEGPTLDQLGVGHFVGKACVMDVSAQVRMDVDLLKSHLSLMEGCEFVLFYTGWFRYWGQDRYFSDFPVLTLEAAEWLAARGLKGIGFDAISADPVGSVHFPNHLVLFQAGMILIENLTGLDSLIGQVFQFFCLPLKINAADGSPVRAVAYRD
jgi:arylformamidase